MAASRSLRRRRSSMGLMHSSRPTRQFAMRVFDRIFDCGGQRPAYFAKNHSSNSLKIILNKVITIERHIIEQERATGGATGDFSGLLRDLTLAIKIIYREVSRA